MLFRGIYANPVLKHVLLKLTNSAIVTGLTYATVNYTPCYFHAKIKVLRLTPTRRNNRLNNVATVTLHICGTTVTSSVLPCLTDCGATTLTCSKMGQRTFASSLYGGIARARKHRLKRLKKIVGLFKELGTYFH